MTSYKDSDRVFTAKVFGPLDDKRVWYAIRFVASAMVNLSKEWPGVLWAGWLHCERHPSQHLYLASSAEARLGKPLLPASGPDVRRCDCLLEPGGVLGLVVKNLGPLLDSGVGPFRDMPDVVSEDPVTCSCVRKAFVGWQANAWRSAKWLFGLAVVLFTTAVVTGIFEDVGALWKSSLAVVCLLVVFAAVASVFACRYEPHEARVEQSGGQTETNVAAFA